MQDGSSGEWVELNLIVQDLISGFALGLSLILAIGAQNVFVLQQGIKRSHVFLVCLTCAVSDAFLIAVGVGGFIWIVRSAEWLEPALLVLGAAFLILYGALSARRAIWPSGVVAKLNGAEAQSLKVVLATCLALTFLNPHVYLDTVVLLGAVASQHQDQFAFGTGAVVASFTFFFSLGYGAKALAPYFQSPRAWRILDAMVALIMWGIAIGLLLRWGQVMAQT